MAGWALRLGGWEERCEQKSQGMCGLTLEKQHEVCPEGLNPER